MKRFFKTLLKGLLGFVIILLIAGLCFYWYVSTRWKKYYTVNEIKEYVRIIENSPTFSNEFYAVFDKLYCDDRHRSITSVYSNILWNNLVMHEYLESSCWYVNAANHICMLKINKGTVTRDSS